MPKVIWQGTADNLALAGIPNGDQHPMRLVEDDDGRLMTEWAGNCQNDNGEIVYNAEWYADYQIPFRDMRPEPTPEIINRMIEDGLLDRR